METERRPETLKTTETSYSYRMISDDTKVVYTDDTIAAAVEIKDRMVPANDRTVRNIVAAAMMELSLLIKAWKSTKHRVFNRIWGAVVECRVKIEELLRNE